MKLSLISFRSFSQLGCPYASPLYWYDYRHHEIMAHEIKVSITDTMQQGFNLFEDEVKEKISKVLAEAKAMEPLPTYTEGEDKEFILGLTQNGQHKKLSSLADEVTTTLSALEADCKQLGLQAAAVLPEFDHAKSEAKRWQGLTCTLTCLKIISSKAAQSLSVSLAKPLETTLDFEAANNLQLNPSLKRKMGELSEKIQKAANPSKSQKR